jgi:energy-coupling factor transport system substrate-specific component
VSNFELVSGVTMPVHTSASSRWSTRDALVVAVIALALGSLIVPIIYAAPILQASVPLAALATSGVWFLAVLTPLAVTRRPGSALLAGVVAGLLQAATSPLGWVALPAMLVRSVTGEALFLVTRYRRFGPGIFTAAGAVAGAVMLPGAWAVYGLGSLALPIVLAFVATQIVSSAAGGLAAWWLGELLARRGLATRRSSGAPTSAQPATSTEEDHDDRRA